MPRLASVSADQLYEIISSQLETLGESAPDNVRSVTAFLVTARVGFLLSRNAAAHSCREARDKRSRLGHKGIPLFDELKSLVGEVVTDQNVIIPIAVHCRADCDINTSKLLEALGVSGLFRLLDGAVLEERTGLEYGIVNPILLELRTQGKELTQIFDVGVTKPVCKIPGTMMTNAGDHTWAIEFDPSELVGALANSRVANIADAVALERASERPEMANPRSIGILTGNGPDSGIALWEAVNAEIVQILGGHFLGDISLPTVLVASVPELGLSMELKSRADQTWEALQKATTSLCDSGAGIVAIACNTTQVFRGQMEALCAEKGAQFVSLSDVVERKVRGLGISSFAIVGIDTVADLGKWSAFSSLADLSVERLSPDILEEIKDIGYLVKQKGNLYRGFQQLVPIFNNQIKAQHILVALTEISIILASQSKRTRAQIEKSIIDTLDLYAVEIARLSLGMN